MIGSPAGYPASDPLYFFGKKIVYCVRLVSILRGVTVGFRFFTVEPSCNSLLKLYSEEMYFIKSLFTKPLLKKFFESEGDVSFIFSMFAVEWTLPTVRYLGRL
jgi:hypothetical protein